ncbi:MULTISPECIES: ATP-binding protein [unclassified Pseudomonas]|uniref:ATP-binding protein n=1 Tax=unclassified Pseudomonas TaxID=196821 RepID=UPI000BD083BA|nr:MULTISPECIES: ATP-binding protein [unclassified Pseudomonas]PVZ19549.1 PAS domain S-box-containing protein [Pseudomonas sp. URIL14HWK12:I12]PVZ22866.1 PAS domain S-box-containing protein [Pseudomonas sp. URIL14HWK12:I10]PVZ37504.1 PAS domain S-box-containing protein [Pseudomonas sp. URIL14HWK12:I11]SNZ14941.1 PAS domain S-box-containing protein [Pseudomonas sp. URIL14HWK12:I9]
MQFVTSPQLKLLLKLLAQPIPRPWRYVLALAMVGVCTLIRSQLPHYMLPYLFFIPFLMMNGFWFGVGPALVSTLVATAAAEYFFVGIAYSFEFTQQQVINNLSFACVSGLMAVVCALFRRNLERLFQTGGDLARQVEHRTEERDSIWLISPDMLGVLDASGRLLGVNPAWQHALGWSEAELLAGHFEQVISPAQLQQRLSEVGKGEETVRFETQSATRLGQPCWLSWHIVASNALFYACVRDVTEVKRHQAALDAAEQQLRQSQKMEAVGQLTGGIAHDFNNLLTAVSGSQELMLMRLRQGRTQDLERYLGVAQGAVQRAAALTHRLLAYARRQTLSASAVNVNTLVADMQELIARTLGPHIQLQVRQAHDLWHCLCDAHQLDNALLNLCINARDAMPSGGQLVIETANARLDEAAGHQADIAPGEYVSVSVSDTGTGMSAQTIQRIFDPFFTTKPAGAGTGLGLSMVYGFVRQSGGQIRARSELGKGSTLTLYLPRCPAGPQCEAKVPANSMPHLAGATLLVVDDEPAIRMVVAEALEAHGVVVLQAGDAATALTILESDAPLDLMMTDVGLPGEVNGAHLAATARQLRTELPVLFITGYAENAVIQQGMLDTRTQVLTKPFAIEALTERLNALIPHRATVAHPQLPRP